MIYNILPSAVQTRIPQLPSLRHSLSAYNVRVRQQGSAVARHSWTNGLDVGFVEAGSVSESNDSRPSSSSSSRPSTPTSRQGAENARGREWSYATHGISGGTSLKILYVD